MNCDLKSVDGDLIKLAQQGQFDLIVHGANCQHIMGGGIARTIKATFPEAFTADKKTKKGAAKFGDISEAIIDEGKRGNKKQLIVVNAYTQIFTGKPRKGEDRVAAIGSAFEKIAEEYVGMKLKIGIPLIGAGLAGGDWKQIEPVICAATTGLDITLVKFKPSSTKRQTRCSLCKALGVNARTCPKNPKSKNALPEKHLTKPFRRTAIRKSTKTART